MTKKRGHNEGSIHQRKDGSWRAQVALQGRRLSFSAKTRRECQEWIKKTKGQIDEGMTFASTKITVAEFLAGWLTNSKASKRSSTLNHYEQLIRSYIVPRIGNITIKDLRPEQIQRLYNQLSDQGVGVYTIRKIHTLLHSAFSQAVKLGIMLRNPASLTMPPKEPSREMTIYDEHQVNQLLLAARGHRWEALFYIAVMTGMRQMELLGLKWTDVDWIKQTIKVERQLVRPNGEGIQFASPKTKLGKRTVTLHGGAIEVLRSHYERQHRERSDAKDKWVESDLIFTNNLGGPIHPRNLLRDYKKLLKDAGLPIIRFHDLRHTAASLMLNNNIPPIVVSRRLGHAKTSITLDIYGHLIPGMDAEAAEIMGELVTPIQLHQIAPRLHQTAPNFYPDLKDNPLSPHI
jgi:integrase